MFRRKNITGIILLFLILFNSPLDAAEPVTHVTIVCDEWQNYTNSDGTGAYWEIVKAVFEPLDIKVKTTVYPWKRATYMISQKKADAIVGEYYYSNSSDYLYPDWHISIEDPIVAFFKRGRINDWDKNGLKSLAKKRVVWIRGYDFDKVFLAKLFVEKHEVQSVEQGLRLIKKDRVDVFLDYEAHIRPDAKKLNMNIARDYEVEIAKLGNKLFVAFSKTVRSLKLKSIFDRRMKVLVESGEIERIYKKWGLSMSKFGKERFGTD